MHESTISVTSPGKLILLGEYAVLEGAPALVSAVNRHCSVRVEPLYNSTFQIRTPNLNIPEIQFNLDADGDAHFRSDPDPKTEKQLRFVLAILKYLTQTNGKIPGAFIEIDTSPFYHRTTGHKFGLGSSAALTVSLLSALSEYTGRAISRSDLYREAFLAHRHAQGKMGSGVDIAASTTGGVMSYTMPTAPGRLDGKIVPLSQPDNLHMVTIWAGYAASTRNFVRNVHSFKQESPDQYRSILNPMAWLSREGIEAYRSRDTDAFLEIVSDFTALERKLGSASGTEIVSDVHEEILSIVKRAGGTYKPSGAGGGDIGVAFCKDPEGVQRIHRAIEQSVFDLMNLELQTDGVRVRHSREIT
jgi:phosphomevalonate kinase